ncbi:MAG: ATP-binding cassette domain-containing protein [Chloroflexi bacterium]|nr:ATP-binding cassette domain-containing protein [Chloroflexota bacterium]
MTVISVEKLSKIYRLGQIGTGTFTNDLKVWWAKTRGKPNPMLKIGEKDYGNRDGDELWALKDINFTVNQGEVLGIIGRNGAGKSTLLKILSRVTAPTSGKVKVKGRIASLLEVGTGFHPELTGRENVYLNGAILGMSKQEVTRKFDEIMDFAEIEKFIDTPVKRYSSGMYVRLAFAVAAHLDPEILVVDEVLAVGDAAFQKKCLGKMGDVSRAGRTVLFVSHNMTAVQSICQIAMMLQEGRLVEVGSVSTVITKYLKTAKSGDSHSEWSNLNTAPGNDIVRIKRVQVIADNENGLLSMQSPLRIETIYWVMRSGVTIHITYHLINELGVTVLTTGIPEAISKVGIYRSVFKLPANLLNSGGHFLKLLIVQDENRVTYVNENIASFTIHDVAEREGAWMGREPGAVQPILPWQTEKLSDDFVFTTLDGLELAKV